MDKRVLLACCAFTIAAVAWHFVPGSDDDKPDSELTIFASREECQADGQTAETCAALWTAAQARANATASLYISRPLCEERYGVGHCYESVGEIARGRRVRYFGPMLQGVALANDLVPKGLQIIAYEPVYPCPQNWADKPVCFQSLRGPIYTEFGKHRISVYKQFDATFRNPDREAIGDETDGFIGHRLIDARYQLVAERSPEALRKSQAVIPGYPRSPERRDPETRTSVFALPN